MSRPPPLSTPLPLGVTLFVTALTTLGGASLLLMAWLEPIVERVLIPIPTPPPSVLSTLAQPHAMRMLAISILQLCTCAGITLLSIGRLMRTDWPKVGGAMNTLCAETKEVIDAIWPDATAHERLEDDIEDDVEMAALPMASAKAGDLSLPLPLAALPSRLDLSLSIPQQGMVDSRNESTSRSSLLTDAPSIVLTPGASTTFHSGLVGRAAAMFELSAPPVEDSSGLQATASNLRAPLGRAQRPGVTAGESVRDAMRERSRRWSHRESGPPIESPLGGGSALSTDV